MEESRADRETHRRRDRGDRAPRHRRAAQAQRPASAAIGNDDLLVATGLGSLDLAALVAKLERIWKVDPFLEAVAITEILTVGDLCRAYRDFLHSA